MALKDVFKISFRTFFNPSAWFGYSWIKTQFSLTGQIFKRIFVPAKPARTETFNEAMKRLKVSAKDVDQLMTRYLSYAYIFLILAFSSLGYGLYVFIWHGSILHLLLTFACAVLFVAFAFQYHFWAFQIKERTLGCTFAKWRQSLFKMDKDKAA